MAGCMLLANPGLLLSASSGLNTILFSSFLSQLLWGHSSDTLMPTNPEVLGV